MSEQKWREKIEKSATFTRLTSQGCKRGCTPAGHEHSKKWISKINIESKKELHQEKERRREVYLEQGTRQLHEVQERGKLNNKNKQANITGYLKG